MNIQLNKRNYQKLIQKIPYADRLGYEIHVAKIDGKYRIVDNTEPKKIKQLTEYFLDLYNRSYYSGALVQRPSPIAGMGSFALRDIRVGELVAYKGGDKFNQSNRPAEWGAGGYWPLDDNEFLGCTDPKNFSKYLLVINHSCNPNVGFGNAICLVAMSNIKKGEELTFDYAMQDNIDYAFKCNCGAPNCRGTITGYDWKMPELQKRYNGYFAPYLQAKINLL